MGVCFQKLILWWSLSVDDCLGKGSVHSVVEEEGCDVYRDGCTIPGDAEGPVLVNRGVRRGRWVCGTVLSCLLGGYLVPGVLERRRSDGGRAPGCC